jgi:ATP-binding cassette, subfamily F, member 3
MLSFKNLSIGYGSKVLIDNTSLQLYVGQKVGLVGQNGCGKTTLFSLILGEIQPEQGDYSLSNNVHIAHVEQEISNVDQHLVEYVLNAHPLIINEQTDLPEYYRLEPNACELLTNLGFSQDELYLPLHNFSGGWQMRANLAKALFVPSDLLLLDEPTNHLDIETVMWLEDWLAKYRGLTIIISHDREFLDNVTTHTLHISQKALTLYSGNYSTFERTLAEHIALTQQAQAKNIAKVKHLQSFVDRFKAKASKAKQAQSRVKMIEKIQISKSIPKDIEYSINFLEPEFSVDKLISISDAEIGYPAKTLLEHAKLDLFQSSRIGLLGRNGIGKSTLIKTLIDGGTLISGEREAHNKIKIGYFAQHTVDQLDGIDTPLSLFAREHPGKREQELRSYLGNYGFSGDKVKETIKNFSGGEKARLTIANIIYHRPNIIFLDEPTNHLDMQMREELAESIQDFSGAVVIVSHDKFLLQSVVDEFYLIDNHKLAPFTGDLDDYHKFLLTKEIADKPQRKKNGKATEATKPKIVNAEHLTSEIKKLEKQISDHTIKNAILEEKIKNLDLNLSDYTSKLTSLSDEYNANKTLIDELESKWLEINNTIDTQ